jgi:hypothetical protein
MVESRRLRVEGKRLRDEGPTMKTAGRAKEGLSEKGLLIPGPSSLNSHLSTLNSFSPTP